MLDIYLKKLEDNKYNLEKLQDAQKEYDEVVDLIKQSDPYFEKTKFGYYGYEYCANPVCQVNPDDYDCPFRCEITAPRKVDISGLYPIRNAFISRKDWLILAIDYSQIELRIAANLSKEPAWEYAFLNDIDVHDATARAVFKTDSVLKWQRKLAKTCNFGALYGGGPGVLAKNAGLELEEAQKIYKAWCDGVPTVMRWIKSVQEAAIKDGYTATFFGRRRPVDLSSNYFKMADEKVKKGIIAGEKRKAGNHAVQGLAADFMKLAMVRVDKEIKKAGLEDQILLLGTVHDELLFEVRQDILLKAVKLIQPLMEVHNFNGGNWKVPLIVDVEASWSWGSVEHYETFILPDEQVVHIKADPVEPVVPTKNILINRPFLDQDADKFMKLLGQFPGDEIIKINYQGSILKVTAGDTDNLIHILREENLIL